VSDFFGALGLRPNVRATVDDVDTMKTVVRAIPGLAIVPGPAVTLERARGDLQMLGLLPPCNVDLACYTLRQGLSRRKQALLTRVLATQQLKPENQEI